MMSLLRLLNRAVSIRQTSRLLHSKRNSEICSPSSPDFEVDRTEPVASGKLEIELKNRIEKLVKVEIAFDPSDNWQITPNQLTFESEAGSKDTECGDVFRHLPMRCFPCRRTTTPSCMVGNSCITGSEKVKFVDEADLHALKDWQILGPFDLGMTEKPIDPKIAPAQFIAEQLPEEGLSDKTYLGKKWADSLAGAPR